MGLVLQAVVGAVAGNVGGALLKTRSLGPLLNTLLGAAGGIAGGQLLGGWLSHLLGNTAAGGVTASALVGLALPLIGGLLKAKA